MDIRFTRELLDTLVAAGAASPCFKGRLYSAYLDVDSYTIDPSDKKLIRRICDRPEFHAKIEHRRVLRCLDQLGSLGKGDTETPIKNLQLLVDAFVFALRAAPKPWIFTEDSEGYMLAWLCHNVEYHPARGRGDDHTPAHTDIDLLAMARGKRRSRDICFGRENLPQGVTKLLESRDAYIATAKLLDDYERDNKYYFEHAERMGEQFWATGTGRDVGGSHWSRSTVQFERDGQRSKVVMDDLDRKGEKNNSPMDFWDPPRNDDDDTQVNAEAEAAPLVPLPVQPFVRVFHLGNHEYVDTHMSNLEPYEYDPKLIEKLVLPKTHKRLIDGLTSKAITRMSDIVEGKAQGVIILCSGTPGTGKTLTAEVYSEEAKRPLYVVQCSQLGTNEEELEKHLSEVLSRATRWRAILLIDEADVYIHERGTSMQQNAIVGVFLRLLEYYGGILFLTTNRVTVVDDAILSRTTAHIRYRVPSGPDRDRLWAILLRQYNVDPSAELIGQAVAAFPEVSGRTIRQLIRLALMLAGKKPLEVKHLTRAAKFHDFNEGKPVPTHSNGKTQGAAK